MPTTRRAKPKPVAVEPGSTAKKSSRLSTAAVEPPAVAMARHTALMRAAEISKVFDVLPKSLGDQPSVDAQAWTVADPAGERFVKLWSDRPTLTSLPDPTLFSAVDLFGAEGLHRRGVADLGDVAGTRFGKGPRFEAQPLPKALASPDLLVALVSDGALGVAAHAYAHDAALVLADALATSLQDGWTDERAQQALRLAFGLDDVHVSRRNDLLGKRAIGLPKGPLPGSPEIPLVHWDDLLRKSCILGVYKAMNQLGAALSSAPRESRTAVITQLVPDRGCPGSVIEIHGRGFGKKPDPGRSLVFPGETGQRIVTVAPGDWSETLIRAVAPADVSIGAVGFVDGNPEPTEFVGPAVEAFAGEVGSCLGPLAAEALATPMRALQNHPFPSISPSKANWFRGGKPRIVAFTGNDSDPVLLRPSSELVLRWQVLNADTVAIRKIGPSQLPALPANAQLGETGEHRFAPLRGNSSWTGRYELTASNPCGSVTATLAVEMKSRSAWALGGGGAKGAFEVGAMRCLVDVFGLQPDIVAGASAGALNAVKIAEGAGGLAELEALWASLRTPADFFTLSGPLRSLLRNLGSEGLGLLKDVQLERMFGWHPSPDPMATNLDIAAKAFGGPMSSLGNVAGGGTIFTVSNIINSGLSSGLTAGKIIQAAQALIASRSLLLLDPVRAKLQASVRKGSVASSGIRLRVAVTSLETGATRYVTETGRFADGQATSDLIDVLQASASIPIAFPPVQLADGDHYCDGGVTENIPIEAAMRAGADEVIAILASPRLKHKPFATGALAEIGARSFELLFDAAERRQLAPYGGWGVPVRIIQPLTEVCSTFQIEAGLVQINRDYGYLRAYEEMQDNAPMALQLRHNTEAWLASRLASWRHAFHANGSDPPDSNLVEITFSASPEAVEHMRLELRRQRDLMATRLQLCGGDRRCLPPGIEKSWLEWGPCDYVIRNYGGPWAEFPNTVVRQVGAETPPAPV